jgi:hypothetical protein
VATAIEAETPPATSASGPPPATRHSAASHHVVTGTSLIGCTSWYTKIGLLASTSAATPPASGPARRLPRMKISHTAAAPSTGTT